MTRHSDYDVAIVGGGPGGLAAAIGFARKGFSTVVLEKKSWPIDKPCGEGLMPFGVSELARLGVLAQLSSENSHPFEGIELISMRKRHMRARFSNSQGLGVRRTALSQAMYEVAQGQSNLTLVANSPVHRVENELDGVRVHSEQDSLKCRLLVGADGLRSVVRTQIETEEPSQSKLRRYGANQHFKIVPWNRFVEVYMSDGLEAYVTPCGNEQVGVAFLWHYDRYSHKRGRESLVDDCLERFPELQHRLRDCEPIGPLQSTGPMRHKAATTVRDGIVLLGDAAGYYDAITGEGMSLALVEARDLVERTTPFLQSMQPIRASHLRAFSKAQKRLQRRSALIAQFTISIARYPALQNLIFSLLGEEPLVFRRLLSLTTTK
jgi:2-polyprenyl-6-methoxyphenol hydroxylase-like FAD-dependent oxidoreductase